MDLIADKIFDKINFTQSRFEKGEYEMCVFRNCDFSNCDISASKFIECEFSDCNLSLAITNDCIFRDIKFTGCKLMGVLFYTCRNFGFSAVFTNCNLSHSSFYQKKIKGTKIKNSRLEAVDFTECDLTNSVFDNCDFLNAAFDRTILEKTDFRSSYNYSINPETNKIKKAKFSLSGIAGLLHRYDIEIDRN